MAEEEKRKVKRVFIDAESGKQISEQTVVTDAKDVATEVKVNRVEASGDPGNRRGFAVLLWVLAIIFEALAALSVMQSSPLYGRLPLFDPIVWMCVFLVLDFVCVVAAGQLWKQANHIDPPSEKNKFEFFLKSQLGAILSIVAFLPFIILTLLDEDADKQTKTVATVVAAIALAVSVGASADFNPVSSEDLQEMEANAIELGDGTVYWTKSGSVYHLNPSCGYIINSDTVFAGDAAAAYEKGLTRPCKRCAVASGDETLKKLSEAGSVTTEPSAKEDAAKDEASSKDDAASKDEAAADTTDDSVDDAA